MYIILLNIKISWFSLECFMTKKIIATFTTIFFSDISLKCFSDIFFSDISLKSLWNSYFCRKYERYLIAWKYSTIFPSIIESVSIYWNLFYTHTKIYLYVKNLSEIFSVSSKIESIIFKCISRWNLHRYSWKNEKHDIFSILKSYLGHSPIEEKTLMNTIGFY